MTKGWLYEHRRITHLTVNLFFREGRKSTDVALPFGPTMYLAAKDCGSIYVRQLTGRHILSIKRPLTQHYNFSHSGREIPWKCSPFPMRLSIDVGLSTKNPPLLGIVRAEICNVQSFCVEQTNGPTSDSRLSNVGLSIVPRRTETLAHFVRRSAIFSVRGGSPTGSEGAIVANNWDGGVAAGASNLKYIRGSSRSYWVTGARMRMT